MREGRKRQIRETGAQLGLPVVKIIRVRIGSLRLGGLKLREWRYLTREEVSELKGEPGKVKPRSEKTGPKSKKSVESTRPRRTAEKGKRR
jgi:23S rRNA pseudouridine2605 synthase